MTEVGYGTREVDKLKLVLASAAVDKLSLMGMVTGVLVYEEIPELGYISIELDSPRSVQDCVGANEMLSILIEVLVTEAIPEAGYVSRELEAPPRSTLVDVAGNEVSFMGIDMLMLDGVLVSAGMLARDGIDSVTGVIGVPTLAVDAAAIAEVLLKESVVLGEATVIEISEVISEVSVDVVANPVPAPAPVSGPV